MRLDVPYLLRPTAAIIVFLMAALTSGLLFAAEAGKDIRTMIDQAEIVRLDTQGAEVIIGNPSVADVAVQSGRLLVVTGKSYGITNIIVLDAQGREILNRRVSVSGDPGRLTLYKGAGRQTWSCAPNCQATLSPGDATEFYEAMSKQTRDKFGVAHSAMEESSSAPQ